MRYPYECAFDFEAMLKKFETKDNEKKLQNCISFIKAYKCKIEKGFFPYDYFDSYDKLNETELPSHDLFYSKIKNENDDE